MQTNVLLSTATADDIDAHVERLLRDLRNPQPPLSLDQVRARLQLDLAYYSASDVSWLRDKIHQMKVAGEQILRAPSSVLRIVRKLDLRAVLLGEKRRILLDKEAPRPKWRWNQAHEIAHDLLPWHAAVAHGDPDTTLSPACHTLIEAEANYGAGRLLFLGASLMQSLRATPMDFGGVLSLHRDYGNTLTSTLWRVVELCLDASFGLVTQHPCRLAGPPDDYIRYLVRSPAFARDYPTMRAEDLFEQVRQRCRRGKGPIGAGRFPLTDSEGGTHVIEFECFYNGYDALTLGRRLAPGSPTIVQPSIRSC